MSVKKGLTSADVKKKKSEYCDTKMITITRAKVGHKRQGSSGI